MLKFNFSRETEILQRIRNNDRLILGELFNRYRRMVQSYIGNNGGSSADAEDILQEAIIVLWQNSAKKDFELTARVSTYLMGIVKRKWYAQSRKQSRIVSTPVEDVLPDLEAKFIEESEDERIEVVKSALSKMGALCQKLLTLFYFEERNMREIANIMEMANDNVAKSKKYQCKKELEKIVFRLMEERNDRS